MQLLLTKGADIDSIYNQETGETILMKLCSKEKLAKWNFEKIKRLMKFLLENGSNRFIKNLEGQDCISILEENPKKNILRPLLIRTQQKTYYMQDSGKM